MPGSLFLQQPDDFDGDFERAIGRDESGNPRLTVRKFRWNHQHSFLAQSHRFDAFLHTKIQLAPSHRKCQGAFAMGRVVDFAALKFRFVVNRNLLSWFRAFTRSRSQHSPLQP